MSEPTGLSYIRRLMRHPCSSLDVNSYYEWWNEEDGWSRDPLEVSYIPDDEVSRTLRMVKQQYEPMRISVIAIKVVGR